MINHVCKLNSTKVAFGNKEHKQVRKSEIRYYSDTSSHIHQQTVTNAIWLKQFNGKAELKNVTQKNVGLTWRRKPENPKKKKNKNNKQTTNYTGLGGAPITLPYILMAWNLTCFGA